MLTIFLRVLLLMISLGLSGISHANPEPAVYAGNLATVAVQMAIVDNGSGMSLADSTSAQMSPAYTQHIGESSPFDVFFAASHDSPQSEPDSSQFVKLWHSECKLEDHYSGYGYPLNETTGNQHSSDSRSLDPAISASSRMANLLRHEQEEGDPLYQLAIELPIEPAPSMTIGYRVDFHPSQDWVLQTNTSRGRIAGWKDSNRLYTFKHHRSLHV